MHLLYGLGAYLVAGLLFAALFAIYGVTRVLSPPREVSIGARLILAPGAALLWPLLFYLWVRSGERR